MLYLLVTGSLGTSVFDMDAFLVGASGGVYALLAAHLANILLVCFLLFADIKCIIFSMTYLLSYQRLIFPYTRTWHISFPISGCNLIQVCLGSGMIKIEPDSAPSHF